MRINIYAKYGTTEKALVPFPEGSSSRDVQIMLMQKFGGNWLLVDNLKSGEILSFSDNTEYRGYSPDFARYSDAIIKIQ